MSPSEGCDDGNVVDDDACSATCEPTLFAVASRANQGDTPQSRQAAAADGRGEVLVVWAATQPARRYSLMARRYSSSGVPRGTAFVIDDSLYDGWDAELAVAGLTEGWAVAWSAHGHDSDGAGIALRRVSNDGDLIIAEPANRIEARAAHLAGRRDGSGRRETHSECGKQNQATHSRHWQPCSWRCKSWGLGLQHERIVSSATVGKKLGAAWRSWRRTWQRRD